MGERRLRASQLAGQDSIPAIVKETADDDLLRDALLENLHRSQLNPLEEAAAYQQLLDDFGCSHEELADPHRPVAAADLQHAAAAAASARWSRAGSPPACCPPDTPEPCSAWTTVPPWSGSPSGSSPKDSRCAASRRSSPWVATTRGRPKPRRPRAGNRHPQLDDLAARLSDRYDTRVTIALGQRKGRLTVEFASVDDLNRIVGLMDRI